MVGWVYPRVCGGTEAVDIVTLVEEGLSPRVRGNPANCGQAIINSGSIPACAGEPCMSDSTGRTLWVYPRVCGGTCVGHPMSDHALGLSPRVRGNPTSPSDSSTKSGSIPACAGEPEESRSLEIETWVYPRVCGGTSLSHGKS